MTDWSCSNRQSKFRLNFRTQVSHALRHVRRTSSPCCCLTGIILPLLVLKLPRQSCSCVPCLSHFSYVLIPSSVLALSVVHGVTPYCLLGMHEPHIFALRHSSNLTLSSPNSYREFQQLLRNCFCYHFTLGLFVISVLLIVIILLVFCGVLVYSGNLGEGGREANNQLHYFSTKE